MSTSSRRKPLPEFQCDPYKPIQARIRPEEPAERIGLTLMANGHHDLGKKIGESGMTPWELFLAYFEGRWT